MLSADRFYKRDIASLRDAATPQTKDFRMITLYHAPQSRSSRFIWLLEELGADYSIHPVSIFRAMTGEGSGDPANPHPEKRVPAIRDGDTVVTESVAVALYLTDRFPMAGIGPVIGSPTRGAYLSWLAWYGSEFEAAMFASMGEELDASPMKRRNYDAVIARLEKALAASPYLLGTKFSAADMLVSSAITFARSAFPASDVIDAYLERCKSRPAAVRALMLDEAEGLQKAA